MCIRDRSTRTRVLPVPAPASSRNVVPRSVVTRSRTSWSTTLRSGVILVLPRPAGLQGDDVAQGLVPALARPRPRRRAAGVADVAVLAAAAGRAREHARVDQGHGAGHQPCEPGGGFRLALGQRQRLEPALARDELVEALDLA